VTNSRLGWYARRLQGMSPAEVGWRVQDRVLQEAWARRSFGPPTAPVGQESRVVRLLPPASLAGLDNLPTAAKERVIAAAEQIAGGHMEILGAVRDDMASPAWSVDPISRRSFPTDRAAFHIDYRDAGDPRNVKQVWELSRHHHLTVLACAWRLTGDDRYAELVAAHLRSWWSTNPVGQGVNWCSGIELGIRLISWVWTRRLLDGWPGAAALFEENIVAAHQIYWHQRFLATFRSRGSSANNHVIAEAAGQLVASGAFPWFAESRRWRDDAGRLLDDELAHNTFPSGLNREQAFDYHGLVAELGLVAAIEAEAAGASLGPATWRRLAGMLDALAAVLDCAGHPPRYGDGDDGRALVVTDPTDNRWTSLLAVGAALFGPRPWWPPTEPDAQSVLLAGLAGQPVDVGSRPATRPAHFPDGGLTLLRSISDDGHEIWCRADSGPHGFLSIAAHAHADALSIELRCDGVELLVDPGTYCYHDSPDWRAYFRSTIGHNTLEIDGRDQSTSGGPFLWTEQARSRLLDVHADDDGSQCWVAEHDGYADLPVPAHHRRSLTLEAAARSLRIVDRVETDGDHALRLAFHLGPTVDAVVNGDQATLRWERPDGGTGTARLFLPGRLAWKAHRGSTGPVLGWYSAGFGQKQPTTTLVGTGHAATVELVTEVQFTS
jgi:hypothetical protein